MSLILNFPSCLRYILLREWMELPDLGRFDCALNNRLLRSEYEAMLESEPLRHVGYTSFTSCTHYENFLTWLFQRKISVEQLKIYSPSNISFLLQQIPQTNYSLFHNLIYISVENLKPYATSNPALNNVEDDAPPISLEEVLINQQLFRAEGKQLQDKIFTEFISILNACPKLQTINFASSIFLEETFFDALHHQIATTQTTQTPQQQLFNIRSLNLNNGHRINAICIEKIIPSFPRLHTLSFRNCRPLQDNSLQSMAQSLPYLRYLNLAFCAKITDIGIAAIADNLIHLETLILYYCKLLKNASLTALRKGKCLKSLRILDISGCHQIDNTGLMTLAADFLPPIDTDSTETTVLSSINRDSTFSSSRSSHITNTMAVPAVLQLEELSCFNCFRIADSSLLYFTPLQLYAFKKLSFANCRLLTNMSIAYLVEHCCNLIELSVKDCIKLSDESFLIAPHTKEDFTPYLLSHSTGMGNQAIRTFRTPMTTMTSSTAGDGNNSGLSQDSTDFGGEGSAMEGTEEYNDTINAPSMLNTEHTHTFVTTLAPLVDDRIDFATSHQSLTTTSSSSSATTYDLLSCSSSSNSTKQSNSFNLSSSKPGKLSEKKRSMLDSIVTLHLEYTAVTDITLYNLAQHAPNVRNVYLTGCKAISSGAILELTRQNHHVHVYIEHE